MKTTILTALVLTIILACNIQPDSLKGYHEANCVKDAKVYRYVSKTQNIFEGDGRDTFYRVIEKLNDTTVLIKHYTSMQKQTSVVELSLKKNGLYKKAVTLLSINSSAYNAGYTFMYNKNTDAYTKDEVIFNNDTNCLIKSIGKRFLRMEDIEHKGEKYKCAVFETSDTMNTVVYPCGDGRNVNIVMKGEAYYAKGLGMLKQNTHFVDVKGYDSTYFDGELSITDFEKINR